MRVVVTGSAGRIATLLVPRIRDRYELVLLDRAPAGQNRLPAGPAMPEYRQVDICDTGALAAAMHGAGAVIHLAGQSETRASWDDLYRPNVEGVVSLFEAARTAGVTRVIFASTNHVTGMYDRDQAWPLSPEQPVRPDSLYGATKAFGEAVGHYYADQFGLSVICLRIGWVLEKPHNEQARMMWLSPGDLTQLICGALSCDVRFGIYYAVSDNARRRWSIDNAKRDLGYAPADDSEAYFRNG
jgi:NAD+ dependent glucose-6-phosphate dehydrogenase